MVNISSSAQLDISRVSTVNGWDNDLDNSCLGIEKDSFNQKRYCLLSLHQINSFTKPPKFMGTPELPGRSKGLTQRCAIWIIFVPAANVLKSCRYQSGFPPLCLPLSCGKSMSIKCDHFSEIFVDSHILTWNALAVDNPPLNSFR